MRRYVFRLAILTLAVLWSHAWSEPTTRKSPSRSCRSSRPRSRPATLKGFSIDLSVEEGTVWLSGRVADANQQAKALDIARRIPGVKQVVNDLTVAAAAAKPLGTRLPA